MTKRIVFGFIVLLFLTCNDKVYKTPANENINTLEESYSTEETVSTIHQKETRKNGNTQKELKIKETITVLSDTKDSLIFKTLKAEKLKSNNGSRVILLKDFNSNQIIRDYLIVKNDEILSTGFVTNDGISKKTERFEYITDFNNDKILSSIPHKKKIKQYSILNSKVETIDVGISPFSVRPLCANGDFIVSDEWELSGTSFNIYNERLQPKESYRPNKKSFFESLYIKRGKTKSVIVVNPETSDKKIKVYVLNSQTGELVFEKELELTKLNIASIAISKNYLLINSFKRLIAFDEELNLIWEKDINSFLHPDIQIDESNQSIIAFPFGSITSIYCIDIESGKTIWTKELTSYIDFKKHTIKSIIQLPLSKHIIIHLYPNSKSSDKTAKIILFDKNGFLLKVIKTNILHHNELFYPDLDKDIFHLVTPEKITSYEVE